VIQYVTVSPFVLGAEPLSASSRTSKHDCGGFLENLNRSDLLTLLKTSERFLGSLKI
jgi:hypothetical protein